MPHHCRSWMATFNSTDGTPLAYHRAGEGHPLICLPGGPMQASAYLGDLGGLSAHRALVLHSFGVALADDLEPDGETALRLALDERPDVIVSDIAMIGEDGYWLVGRLRQLPPEMLAPVPVIAATAYGREHSRERVLAAGFTAHLQKPVDPEELCRVVAKVIGR